MSSKRTIRFIASFLMIVASAAALSVESRGDQTLGSGLFVQLGEDDIGLAGLYARTGQYLVQILQTDETKIEQARQRIETEDLTGLVSVEQVESFDRLPFAENLVNRIRVDSGKKTTVPLTEIFRVLCPEGMVIFADEGPTEEALSAVGFEGISVFESSDCTIVTARKPWPEEMDAWSHPRHGADGNTVSADGIVGPPRRVRWVTGPFREIGNMVTADGRIYYGGLWARDAFNGLKLWDHKLSPSPARGGFSYRNVPGSFRPIAIGAFVMAVDGGVVKKIDGRTGEAVLEFPEAGTPSDLLNVDRTLISICADSIRALSSISGRLQWQHEATAPRYVVADKDKVVLIEGDPKKGETVRAVCLDIATGDVRWQIDDQPWIPAVRRIVLGGERIAMEVSTLCDDKEGNEIHVIQAADGKELWSHVFVPSQSHYKQARAMFIGDRIWIVTDRKCTSLDPATGKVDKVYQGGLCHCFPPVATEKFYLSGEMELTNLVTGEYDSNHITKAACGRDFGWMPANGLINIAPKHCVCWPMLRGYTALAAAAPEEEQAEIERVIAERDFLLIKGPAEAPKAEAKSGENGLQDADWPCYRHDAWRSGATTATAPDPTKLEVLWSTKLADWPESVIVDDWRENPFVHGLVTAPTVVGNTAFVAIPDKHRVVALDTETGGQRWQFTAGGRVDTAPTISRGLCLFGCKSGWVYCVRADNGKLVWRLRAAPIEARIVAYGQVESPWPVPGSILVVDDTAYFAAGRHPLADGGILLFAVEPATGKIRWTARHDTLPTKNFYGSSGLEFDNFDLLHRENDEIAMSRWFFPIGGGDELTCRPKEAFARLTTDGLNVVIPRRPWSYAPRHQTRTSANRPEERPLAVFAGNSLIGCRQDQRTVYRRDYDAESIAQFDTSWLTGWAAQQNFRKPEADAWRTDRTARGAAWSIETISKGEPGRIAAMALAGDTLLLAGQGIGLAAVSTEDGEILGECNVPEPIWDGMAVAGEKIFLSTAEGSVICVGAK